MSAKRSPAAQPGRQPGEQLERAFSDYLGMERVRSGWGGESSATTPTATLTTSRASSGPPPLSPPSNGTRATPTTNRWPRISLASRLPAPPMASNSQLSNCLCPARSSSATSACLPATLTSTLRTVSSSCRHFVRISNDRVALGILAELFPDREVIGIYAVGFGLGPRNPALHDPAAAFLRIASAEIRALEPARWTQGEIPNLRHQQQRAKCHFWRTIFGMTTDLQAMNEAIAEARKAAAAGEVPIGAVLVCRGELIARGQNSVIRTTDPTAHAEIVVLRQAARNFGNYRLLGCTSSSRSSRAPCARGR